MHDAQPIFLTQGDHECSQILVGYAGAKLTVQRVDCRWPQRIAMNILNGLVELLRLEKCAFRVFRESLQLHISAEASRPMAVPAVRRRSFLR